MSKNVEISVKNIHVDDAFWNHRIENAVENVIPYQWRVLNDQQPGAAPSHAVMNFKIAAGLEKGEFYGYVFQDSDLAKWIEAASLSLIYKQDPQVMQNLEDVIGIIEKAQQPDGYLDTHYILKKPDKKWKEIAHGHELYCAGHMLEAAVAYYTVTGSDRLLKVMEKNVDLIRTIFGDEEGKLPSYPGHEEIELALMKAYRVTGQQKYMDLAEYFVNKRGHEPGFFQEESFIENSTRDKTMQKDYHQAHAPIREQKTAEGHAVRAMYYYTGAADVALENGDESLVEALRVLWKNVTNRRMYITGGVGSQGDGERFTIDYDLPNDTCYTETCAAVGMAMWGLRMLKIEPKSEYADVMERALYNNVLSGISEDGEHYFYVNPLMVKPDVANYRSDHISVETKRVRWFGCACCPPNVIRTLCGLGGYIYTQKEDAVYQHLYVGNEAVLSTSQGEIRLSCTSQMPWQGEASVTYHGPQGGKVFFRIPAYAKGFSICKEGNPVVYREENGYALVEGGLEDGCTYTISFEMEAQFILANPRVTEDCAKAAVLRGPLVYCAEEADNGPWLNDFRACLETPAELEKRDLFGGICGLKVSGSRSSMECWDADTLYLPAAKVCGREKASLHLIPYFLWNNRGEGEMLVWMNTEA